MKLSEHRHMESPQRAHEWPTDGRGLYAVTGSQLTCSSFRPTKPTISSSSLLSSSSRRGDDCISVPSSTTLGRAAAAAALAHRVPAPPTRLASAAGRTATIIGSPHRPPPPPSMATGQWQSSALKRRSCGHDVPHDPQRGLLAAARMTISSQRGD